MGPGRLAASLYATGPGRLNKAIINVFSMCMIRKVYIMTVETSYRKYFSLLSLELVLISCNRSREMRGFKFYGIGPICLLQNARRWKAVLQNLLPVLKLYERFQYIALGLILNISRISKQFSSSKTLICDSVV